jgi:hypothetical protein
LVTGCRCSSERVGEGSWTLPLEIAWLPPWSGPVSFGLAQVETFVAQHGWESEQMLAVDAQYTVVPFLRPVHQLGVSVLGRVRSNRCFYLPPPTYAGRGRPRVRGRKIKLNDQRTLPHPAEVAEWELPNGGRIEVGRWDEVRLKSWPEQSVALYRVREYRADGHQRYRRPLWLIFVPGQPQMAAPTPRQAEAIYHERFSIEMRQTQPIKMTWRPLRRFRRTIDHPRGRFKRESEMDVNLFSRDDDFIDQALHDNLTFFKREPFEIVAE